MTEVFDQEAKLRGKTIKFRKWKVKDKKKYLENIKNIPVSREALIYDCLEDKRIALDDEELKYMLIQIRMASLSDPIDYTFNCEKCNKDYEFAADLRDIVTMEGTNVGDIVSGDNVITFGNITNKDFYQDLFLSADTYDAKELVDFMLHIRSFNGNDGFTFEMLNEYISEMDAKSFEDIFEKWMNMRQRVNNVSAVVCPHCGHEEWYEFDALPGFFPPSWRIE